MLLTQKCILVVDLSSEIKVLGMLKYDSPFPSFLKEHLSNFFIQPNIITLNYGKLSTWFKNFVCPKKMFLNLRPENLNTRRTQNKIVKTMTGDVFLSELKSYVPSTSSRRNQRMTTNHLSTIWPIRAIINNFCNIWRLSWLWLAVHLELPVAVMERTLQ